MSWRSREVPQGGRKRACGRRPWGGPARAWWECDGVMLYLGADRLHAVIATRFGRVVDAVSVPWTDGLCGNAALKLCEEVAAMGLVRRSRVASDGTVPPRVQVCKLSKQYALLWEFLTRTKWDGEEPREPGTVFLMMQDGVLKASLSDRDSDQVLWIAGTSLSELLDCCEAALSDPGADWRLDRKMLAKRATGNGNGKLDRRSRGG